MTDRNDRIYISSHGDVIADAVNYVRPRDEEGRIICRPDLPARENPCLTGFLGSSIRLPGWSKYLPTGVINNGVFKAVLGEEVEAFYTTFVR